MKSYRRVFFVSMLLSSGYVLAVKHKEDCAVIVRQATMEDGTAVVLKIRGPRRRSTREGQFPKWLRDKAGLSRVHQRLLVEELKRHKNKH